MPTKIDTEIRNGELLAASQEMIQQRLEEFAKKHPRLRELDVSVDVGNPDQAEVEITAPLGDTEFVGQGAAKSAVESVDGAIQNLHHQLLQRLRDRKAEAEEEEEPVDSEHGALKMSHGVAAVLVAGIFIVVMTRMGSCAYDPTAGLPELGTVTGKLTLDGEPIQGATISFYPLTGGRMAEGLSDDQGNYTLRYNRDIAGTKVGPNEVTITTFQEGFDYGGEEDFEDMSGRAEEIPEKYATEKLKVNVEPGSNTINLALTSD